MNTDNLISNVIEGIENVKGEEINILDLRSIENVACKYFIICTGNSSTQVNAITSSIKKCVSKELSEKPWHIEGLENCKWVLIDYVDVVVFAVMAVGSFSIGVWMVSGGGSVNKVFKEPMVWATLLGALFLIQGWQTPKWATNTLELMGQMAIPLMLITLGVALARLKMKMISRAITLSVLKLIVSIGVAWIIGVYFDLNDVAFAVLVMQIATPVAVTSYLLAQKYGADANEVAGLVIASTVLSVFALPVLLGVLL